MDQLPIPCAAAVKVKANTKVPFYKDWPNKIIPEDELLSHYRNGGNIGIKTRYYPAFDIDVDDPSTAHEIAQFIQNKHSPWCVRKREGSPRFLIAFKLKEDQESFKKQVIAVRRGKVELLADGQQFVAWGTHPSGGKYQTTILDEDDCLSQEDFRALFQSLNATFGIEPNKSIKTITQGESHTHHEIIKTIVEWDAKGCRYDMLRKLAYMNEKEGISEAYNIRTLRALMHAVDKEKRDDEWQLYMKEKGRLERLVTDLKRLENPCTNITEADPEPRISNAPVFPGDTVNEWPDPWPLIWENWKRFPLDLNETLLFPTMIAAHAFLLRANYLTEYGRRPNFFFLNLAPSTAGKDINSTDVIADIDDYLKSVGCLHTPFTQMRNRGMNITADTSFLESINDNELFWIHTEASNIFRQLKNSANNNNVAALSDKMIEVVDGKMISGKMKSGKKIDNVTDPNIQILFYAQPETIEDSIDIAMVDSGLFGRSLISIVPNIELNISKFSLFQRKRKKLPIFDGELRHFYTKKLNTPQHQEKNRINIPDHEKDEMDKKWSQVKIANLLINHKQDDCITKLLLRMGTSAEQLYTVVCGIAQLWATSKKCKYKPIAVEKLIPILDYWVDCKMYAIDHIINSSVDPLSDIYVEAIHGMLDNSSFYRKKANKNQREMLQEGYVARSRLKNHLAKSKRLLRMCRKDKSKVDISVRVDYIHASLLKNNIIVVKDHQDVSYVALLAL